eukprot:gene4320-4369_t
MSLSRFCALGQIHDGTQLAWSSAIPARILAKGKRGSVSGMRSNGDLELASVTKLYGATVAIRTDHLLVRTQGQGLRAVVTDVEYQGAWIQANLRTQAGAELVSLVPEAAFDSDPFQPGDEVSVGWDPSAVHRLA